MCSCGQSARSISVNARLLGGGEVSEAEGSADVPRAWPERRVLAIKTAGIHARTRPSSARLTIDPPTLDSAPRATLSAPCATRAETSGLSLLPNATTTRPASLSLNHSSSSSSSSSSAFLRNTATASFSSLTLLGSILTMRVATRPGGKSTSKSTN